MIGSEVLRTVDHTLLKPDAVWEQIRTLCDEAVEYGTASVCIPPCFVERAAAYLGGRTAVCTVVGFPNGYATTGAKCFEAAEAAAKGADELDMVINIGWAREGRFDAVLEEIRAVRAACAGKLLKVIVETCLLTDEEKIRMCRIVSESGVEFIKTSTGFSSGGATLHDIELFAAHVSNGVRIKAAGGIGSAADAETLLRAGASRLGTSRLVRLAMQERGART